MRNGTVNISYLSSPTFWMERTKTHSLPGNMRVACGIVIDSVAVILSDELNTMARSTRESVSEQILSIRHHEDVISIGPVRLLCSPYLNVKTSPGQYDLASGKNELFVYATELLLTIFGMSNIEAIPSIIVTTTMSIPAILARTNCLAVIVPVIDKYRRHIIQ